MGKELRREPRVRTDFDVEIETGGQKQMFPTRNASFSGVFVVCEEPFPLRRLVRMRADIGQEVELLGLVAHTLNAADAHELGKKPGMGINVFGLGPEQREVWNSFVREEYEKDPEAHAALMASELPRLKVHLKSEKMTEQFFGRDLPTGEIFYRTPELLPPGSRVVCEVTHPKTGKVLELFGNVTETVQGSRRKRGIRVGFDEFSEATTGRVDQFARRDFSEAADSDEATEE